MTMLAFTQVDAFADRAFAGNPAAVIPLDGWLGDSVLQAIAEENNLDETAFIGPTTGDADYELRWFTPAVEVALCGHGTLASGHVLLSADSPLSTVRFRTRKSGILTVSRAASGYRLSLPAWRAEPQPLPDLAAALGVTPIETLRHPGGYDLVVLADAAAVRAVTPDFRALAAIGDTLNIVTAPGEETDVISRVFAPAAGIDEDPVTGSAHGLLTPYWAARLGRPSFTAFQASKRGGHVHCTLDGDRAILGGQCVTVIEGRFRL